MNVITRIVRVSIAAALAVAGVMLWRTECFSAEASNLRVVYNALGGSMAPIWVSQELGLFAKHGLQHNLNYLAATTAVQAMAAGSEEIGLVGNQGIDMALEGADTVYIASTCEAAEEKLPLSATRTNVCSAISLFIGCAEKSRGTKRRSPAL